MKKLMRKLRPGVTEQLTIQPTTTPSGDRFPPEIQTLADAHDRFGLHLIPSSAIQAKSTTEQFDLDIIAVHGLGGDFLNTWTKVSDPGSGHDVFWLSQLLPATLPGARIYSFGYDSKPAFSKSVAKIRDFSKQLLELLLAQLPGKQRSIIFVCHSLGGLVVKQAIITAHEDERFAQVLRMTKAIMFMGTPHRGSDIAASLRPLIDAINFGLKYSGGSIIAGRIRDDLVQLLSRNSNALDEINESFMPRAKGMHINSFYETVYADNLNQPVVSQQSAVLRIPDEAAIPLIANHINMCRFSSLSDSNYQLVSNALIKVARTLSRVSEDLSSTSAQSPPSLTDSERRYTSYFQRGFQQSLSSERIEGTCRWLLDTPQYQKWQADASSAILWITGDAGCGKTTLVSFIAEVLRGEASQAATGSLSVMTFFCAKNISTCNDGRSIACGLINSILTSRRSLIRRVKAEFAPVKQEFGQSLEHLWNILMFTLDATSCSRYYIVIDAVDECKPLSRERLLACIGRMLDSYKEKDSHFQKKIKLLFTSQPQTMTEWRALDHPSDLYHVKIEDRPPGMTQDILAFISYKVDQLVQLRRCDLIFAQKLKDALYQKAQNSFLWVSLVLAHIKTTILLHPIDPWQLLANVPYDLNGVYQNYLPPLRPQNTGAIRKCVQLLVASCRTLTLDEVAAFTGPASPDCLTATPEQLTILQNNLELMFGPLVRFPNLQVEFAHSTVKDFFLSMGQDTSAVANVYGTDIVSAHLMLAEACVNYLLHDDMSVDHYRDIEPSSATTLTSLSHIDASQEGDTFSTDIFDVQDVMFLKNEEVIDEEACSYMRSFFTSFDYAARNWAHHFASCEHIAPETLKQKVRSLSKPSNVHASNWYRYMAHHSSTPLPDFHRLDELLLAAMFDHRDALRALFSSRPLNYDDGFEARCQLGLFWAASRGHANSVKVLLENGTSPNFLENGQSPLIVAVLGGHQNVCEVLLQTPTVSPNLSDRSSRSPLIHAVASDQKEIMGMLLSHEKIVVNASDRFGFTPLLEAALYGCLHCIRRLKIDGRSDFQKRDKNGRDALSYAACTNSLASVDYVLRSLNSEQIQSSDSSGRTAISYAAERSPLSIVKRLLKSNVSVSQADKTGRNAISWAVSRPALVAQKDEENTVLRFLVDKFPQDADVKDVFGWTPLAWALDRPGDLTSIRILVEIGRVDVNQQDHSGKPVLSWAASEAFENIVCYLLQVPGINKNMKDLSGRTPISYAAAKGSLIIVQHLLASGGIDLSITDDKRRSPSDWARLNHHDDVVQELDFVDHD